MDQKAIQEKIEMMRKEGAPEGIIDLVSITLENDEEIAVGDMQEMAKLGIGIVELCMSKEFIVLASISTVSAVEMVSNLLFAAYNIGRKRERDEGVRF